VLFLQGEPCLIGCLTSTTSHEQAVVVLHLRQGTVTKLHQFSSNQLPFTSSIRYFFLHPYTDPKEPLPAISIGIGNRQLLYKFDDSAQLSFEDRKRRARLGDLIAVFAIGSGLVVIAWDLYQLRKGHFLPFGYTLIPKIVSVALITPQVREAFVRIFYPPV
jgi:hypothetical protein